MKHLSFGLWVRAALVVLMLSGMALSCSGQPYMKMDPPPDSDKPLPVPAGDNSCWLHSSANMLAGAGYGDGNTVQARADDIFGDLFVQYGVANPGWMDTALNWWLASANNTWGTNPYTVVTVIGDKDMIPWDDADGAMRIANELRSCNMVSMGISWPDGLGGYGGHGITAWGDSATASSPLTSNPLGLRVTDSDTDTGGDVQAYTYDTFNNPNPDGQNEGNGWYFNRDNNHPYIRCLITLSPTLDDENVPNTVRVTGSMQIHQDAETDATDLHYTVGTDTRILTYRTWIDWPGKPTITEDADRHNLTVDWDLSEEPVPHCTWVTISTEAVESIENNLAYSDIHFTYPVAPVRLPPDLYWGVITPVIDKAESIPNVTGGYVIGAFDVYSYERPDEPAMRYRFVHQYLYTQSPEQHTLLIKGTKGYFVTNLYLGHSYGYPEGEKLWRFEDWMTKDGEKYDLDKEEEVKILVDWTDRLPYPEGLAGSE